MPEYRRRLPHFHPNYSYPFLTWRLRGRYLAEQKNPRRANGGSPGGMHSPGGNGYSGAILFVARVVVAATVERRGPGGGTGQGSSFATALTGFSDAPIAAGGDGTCYGGVVAGFTVNGGGTGGGAGSGCCSGGVGTGYGGGVGSRTGGNGLVYGEW